jgi:hypothetical protein
MKIKGMKWADGHVVRMGQIRNGYKSLVGKSEGKRLLGRPRCRGKDNIRMDLKDIGWEDVDWMYLDQDTEKWRVAVNTVMDFRVP